MAMRGTRSGNSPEMTEDKLVWPMLSEVMQLLEMFEIIA